MRTAFLTVLLILAASCAPITEPVIDLSGTWHASVGDARLVLTLTDVPGELSGRLALSRGPAYLNLFDVAGEHYREAVIVTVTHFGGNALPPGSALPSLSLSITILSPDRLMVTLSGYGYGFDDSTCVLTRD